MAAGVENESEIVLGNKQLLGVFAVIAVLLAVAFGSGFLLGKKSSPASPAANAESTLDKGITRTLNPDDGQTGKSDSTPVKGSAEEAGNDASPAETKSVPHQAVLGAPKPADNQALPAPGQTFLQVTAVTRVQAAATAEVLRKQNYKARIAPKPGSGGLYRVLVGPVIDAGDLSATRDSLRKIGFRDVFVQHY